MIKPTCPDFRPSPTAAWLCWWWNSETDEPGVAYFCSRPDWDYRTCPTQGLRNIPEDALTGPVGINVARLLGIELPPVAIDPEAQLLQNVKAADVGEGG